MHKTLRQFDNPRISDLLSEKFYSEIEGVGVDFE